MSTRMALRDIKRMADIDVTHATSVTYFPFFEYTDKIAYAAGIYGWNGSLYRGLDSRLYYAVTDMGNDGCCAGRNVGKMGEREKYVMRTLERVEEVEHPAPGSSVVRFFSSDGEHSFSVATSDHGKTWEICG